MSIMQFSYTGGDAVLVTAAARTSGADVWWLVGVVVVVVVVFSFSVSVSISFVVMAVAAVAAAAASADLYGLEE
jgi:hypothetical protein